MCGTANKGLCPIDSANVVVKFAATFDRFDDTIFIGDHGWIVTDVLRICEAKANNQPQEIKRKIDRPKIREIIHHRV